MSQRPIRRAILTVTDKTGLVEFARGLVAAGVELVATGGTKQALDAAGIPAIDVTLFTQFPEMLDGRVKTLHPALYAGILADRSKPAHLQTLADHQLPEFDLVVCNLYAFAATVAAPGVTDAMAIEKIDIGGPCLIRAAAKNFASVAVVADPAHYADVLSAIQSGGTTLDYRRQLAWLAFETIAEYDRAIRDYFAPQASPQQFPAALELSFDRQQSLRYGENSHQAAAFYVEPGVTRSCIATASQLHGKELSYNNILDLDSALNLVREFDVPAAVVVKHNNPCGAATAATLAEAFQAAWDGDPLSAFGGILAFNRPLDLATANAIRSGERFVECVIAPGYEPAALDLLAQWKKNVRLMQVPPLDGPPGGRDYRRVDGGLLAQERDTAAIDPASWKCVTKAVPTAEQHAALLFAWTACKHVKSNAIVLAAGTKLVGVGAGQMSRVVSVQIAIQKAGAAAAGSVLASDAFFPFPDNVELAAAAGVTAIVQPGGSLKDAESIAAC
ncbi:MAG: bifunctional phosphoribosylaminoimidazolecarboxamide formyltransferase/IMP cyclohydrolase, partial [Gemmataceae bacterium]